MTSARAWLRVAGRVEQDDGSIAIWSVAEGRQGRRWRVQVTRGGQLQAVALIEVGTGGRPTRLEVSTSSGMLTLHPEDGGQMLHGNVVAAGGMVRPLAFAWGPKHELDLATWALPLLVGLHRRRASVAEGEAIPIPVVRVGEGLRVEATTYRALRTGPDDWRLTADGGRRSWTLTCDSRGLPGGDVVPLED